MHRTKARFNRRPLMWTVIIFLVVATLILTALETTGMTHMFHTSQPAFTNPKNNTPTKGGASTSSDKGEPSSSSGYSTSNTSGNEPGDNKSPTGSSSQEALAAPSGDFVSNHHPDLSGSPAPNTISSVCITTPGATCVISFTKGSITKSLAPHTTDRGGSAYWSWKLQDIGLTGGSWQIKATASINNKTVSTTDALALEVGQ